MNLLKSALYDPAAAVSKATSALLAMTAFDTVNLRLAITVPAHGMVRFRLRCAIVGATTCPVILLGVLNGATVIGRVQPVSQPLTAPAATQVFTCDAEFTVTGLAPGAMNVDAAYAVQVVVAATNIKYGGPNTNAGANAWGGFVFEAWDPQPQTANSTLAVDANGRVDVSKVLGGAINALVAGRMDSSVGAMAASVITAAAHAAGAIDANAIATDAIGSAELAATAVAKIVAGIWDELTATARTAGSYGQLVKDDINATISSRATSAALATVQADTDDIQTRLPAALVGGRIDASVGAMAAAVITAAAHATDAVDANALAGSAADEIAAKILLNPVNKLQTFNAGGVLVQQNDDKEQFLNALVEGTLTTTQVFRIMLAALAGKMDGLAGTTVHARDQADTKNRITATVDANGNRTAVAVDGI